MNTSRKTMEWLIFCDGMVNLRYVDDILPAFDNEQDSLIFFGFLNKRHPGIKFTIEK